MKVEIRERMGKDIDEMLSPDDKFLYRCADCQTWLLPREIHQLKRRMKLEGAWTYDVRLLCPVCFPDPSTYRHAKEVPESPLMMMNREEYEISKKYEAAHLIPPQFSGMETRSGLIVRL